MQALKVQTLTEGQVDPIRQTVRVQGGATLGDIDRATQPFSLAVPVGLASATGIEANWTDPGQSDANIAWARDTFEELQQFAHGTYLNFPGFMEDADKLLQGAYEANYERLATIKTQYDPDNLFHGVLNIVPRP